MITNKTFFYLPLIFSLILGSIGCSDSNEDEEIYSQTEEIISQTDILGTWELRLFDRGWVQQSEFLPNKVICVFNHLGVLEVTNKSGVNLSPFMTNGTCPFSIDPDNKIIINGISFDYLIEKDTLRLFKNTEADGPYYKFFRTH